jgi:hypothetical protein
MAALVSNQFKPTKYRIRNCVNCNKNRYLLSLHRRSKAYVKINAQSAQKLAKTEPPQGVFAIKVGKENDNIE